MLEYTRYPDDDFTWFVLKGDKTIEEWLQTVRRFVSEGMTRYELYDLRARVTPFTTDEIEQIVHQTIQDVPLRPSNGKTAIVVDESLKYGPGANVRCFGRNGRPRCGYSTLFRHDQSGTMARDFYCQHFGTGVTGPHHTVIRP